jgi:DNA repair photolyase
MPGATASRLRQELLFDANVVRRPSLPIVGQQRDIRYYASRARSIINPPESTGMDFWSINPYVGCAFGCAYCYARYTHGYVMDRAVNDNPERGDLRADRDEMPSWLAFERRIMVKENAAEVLRRTLRHGSERLLGLTRGEHVQIGTATDPYQPAERRYRLTRGMLEVLAEHAELHIGITTKSPLITRDIDLLTRIARTSWIRVHISLITVDRDLARKLEPRAPTPEARLRAVARLASAGVRVGVNVMPVLPGITDAPAQLDALVRAIAASGATRIGTNALQLRAAARKRYLPFIEQEFPALAPKYRATYERGYLAGDKYRAGLARVMRRLCERYGVNYGVYGDEDDDGAVTLAAHDQLELELPPTPVSS